MKSLVLSLFLVFAATSARAIILYGGDNATNITDPGSGVPWQSVAGVAGGSAVYIGNGYMLTADHVSLGGTVTFNGSDSYTIDGSSIQSFGGGVDLKVFRLTTMPSVAAASLLLTGIENFGSATTMIGWGVGRDPSTPINSNTVPWGDGSTIAKRWGENVLRGYGSVSDGSHSYQGLISIQGSSSSTPAGLGANEAAATLYDSGSGVFQQINGTWWASRRL